MLNQYHEAQQKVEKAYAEIRSRNKAVHNWLAQQRPATIPDCCAACCMKQLRFAVDAEDAGSVKNILDRMGS